MTITTEAIQISGYKQQS